MPPKPNSWLYLLQQVREALEMEPNREYALALANCGKLKEAQAVYLSLLRRNPRDIAALYDLGAIYNQRGDTEAALTCCEQILTLQPNNFLMWCHKGNIYSQLTRFAEADACFRHAHLFGPNFFAAYSDRLLNSNYVNMEPEERFRLHREVGLHWERPFSQSATAPRREGRMRVGYVSADLRHHALAYFLKGVLPKHDRTRFEIFYYSNSRIQDSITTKFREAADHWHQVETWSDKQLDRQIRADQVDILVDLSGHTSGHRLPVFLGKPAPVQFSWLGYLNSTGLKCMDFRLTDRGLCPEQNQALYTEKLCHLSNTLSYSPPEQAPEISPLPALKNGFVTFGSFNNLKKVNEHVLQLWARILMSVEDSRLLFLGCDAAVERQRLVDGLGRLGISRERLEMLPTLPTTEFLQAMARADLALDPFPHVGGATTAHSLWMGVPVITLEGHCEFERISACLLRNAGHSEWVAPDAEAYKEIALKWSTDLAGLADLRLTLRERLSDRSGALIQDIEEIYTQIMACSDDQELGSMF